MPELTVTTLLVYSFPEAIVIFWVGLSLMGYRPRFYRTLGLGILMTVFDAFFFLVVTKLIILPFGVHTVIELVFGALLVRYVMQLSYAESFMVEIFGFTILDSLDALMLPVFFLVTGHAPQVLNANNWIIRLPYFVSKLVLMVLLVIVSRYFHIGLTTRTFAKGKDALLWLGGLLLLQVFLMINLCIRYYAHHTSEALDWPFVLGNAVVPVMTLFIMGIFLWDYTRMKFHKK